MNQSQAVRKMPRYLCHKQVWALKIQDIAGNVIMPAESGYGPFDVSDEYMAKHKPVVGGYFVVYADGYKSFSPADVFEAGYALIDNFEIQGGMTFGTALERLKMGNRVARRGWNGKGQWVALQLPDANSKMQSGYAYLHPVGGVLVPWAPSQSDMLADDWMIVHF